MRPRVIMIFLLAFFLCIIYFAPIIFSGSNLGIQDWDQNLAWNEFIRQSLLTYHQFPYWDPYRCGGTAHFANPQISVISIQTLMILFLGTVLGTKLTVLVHGIIGFLGAYLLTRYYKLSPQAGIIAAILFSFNGIIASFLSTGMLPFTNYVYSPYILYCFLRGKESYRWIIAGAAVFAMSYLYSSHVLLLLLVYLALYSVFAAITHREVQYVSRFLIFTAVAVLFSAPKLALSLQLMTIFPRYINAPSGYTFSGLFHFLASRQQDMFGTMPFTNFSFGVDENSLYVGFLPLVLLVIGIFGLRKRLVAYLPEMLAFLFITLLMLGDTITPSLFQIIKHMPLYASFGVAQRFRLVFMLPLIILIGLGFDHATSGRLKRFRLLICLVLAGIIYTDQYLFSASNFLSQTFIIKDTPISNTDRPFVQQKTFQPPEISYVENAIPRHWEQSKTFLPYSYEFHAIRQNIGVISCYDAITDKTFAAGSDEDTYHGEWYTAHNMRTISLISWTPHRIQFAVEPTHATASDTLILNQNYYPGWYVRTNRQFISAINMNGLLAAPLDAATKEVTFVYLPYRGFIDHMFGLLRTPNP